MINGQKKNTKKQQPKVEFQTQNLKKKKKKKREKLLEKLKLEGNQDPAKKLKFLQVKAQVILQKNTKKKKNNQKRKNHLQKNLAL